MCHGGMTITHYVQCLRDHNILCVMAIVTFFCLVGMLEAKVKCWDLYPVSSRAIFNKKPKGLKQIANLDHISLK